VATHREWGEPPRSLIGRVVARTVNGFIALGPIPGCRGAASCRPPRSWPLDRRSGRVPALPYPPPRRLQFTPEHAHSAICRELSPLATPALRHGEPARRLQTLPHRTHLFPQPDSSGTISARSHGTPSPPPNLRRLRHARHCFLLEAPGAEESLEGRSPFT
jgi:hypothetical protein